MKRKKCACLIKHKSTLVTFRYNWVIKHFIASLIRLWPSWARCLSKERILRPKETTTYKNLCLSTFASTGNCAISACDSRISSLVLRRMERRRWRFRFPVSYGAFLNWVEGPTLRLWIRNRYGLLNVIFRLWMNIYAWRFKKRVKFLQKANQGLFGKAFWATEAIMWLTSSLCAKILIMFKPLLLA